MVCFEALGLGLSCVAVFPASLQSILAEDGPYAFHSTL